MEDIESFFGLEFGTFVTVSQLFDSLPLLLSHPLILRLSYFSETFHAREILMKIVTKSEASFLD